MGNIIVNNREVLHAILKTAKKDKTGLDKLFLSKISEDEAKKMKKLYFRDINITDLDFLKYFPNLEKLTFMNIVGIKDTSGFAYCCNLKNLDIYDTYIEDFESLKYCTELEYFDYLFEKENSKYKCLDFSFLQNFKRLYQVDLTGNNVEDISILSEHPSLEQLILEHNPIHSIAPLKNIEKLKYLDVCFCGLSELEDIEQFSTLTDLYATNNKFNSIQIERYKQILNSLKNIEF